MSDTYPSIGLGFWQVPADQAANIAYEGLKAGYRLLDSAELYGNEREVSEGISKWINEDPSKHLRRDVLYTTKIDPQALGYEATKKVLKESLEKARSIGYIDLVLIHAPRGDTEKRLGSWKALEEAVESGDVKDIGVSNYEIEHLQELLENPNLKIKPSINQLEVQPWFTREKLIAFNKKAGIEVEAYSPLTRGKKLDDKELVELGKKYGKSPAQILIRWSIDKGYIPLPRTTKEKRLEDNFDVFDFKLSEGDVKVLDGKDENLRSRDI